MSWALFLAVNCTCCTCTKTQINDPDYAENHWYQKDRSRDQNLALYQSLEKKADGSIKTSGVSTEERLGLCQKPMGDFLDWTGNLSNVVSENMILYLLHLHGLIEIPSVSVYTIFHLLGFSWEIRN